METISIGPCKCGGYGQVYDSETEQRLGRCHTTLVGGGYLDDIALRAARKVAPHLTGSIAEVARLKALIQVAVREALDDAVPNAPVQAAPHSGVEPGTQS